MYIVTVHHHDKDWVRGDLEDKFELVESKNFKTKKEAKKWILLRLITANPKATSVEWHKGDKPSYAYFFTGVTWQNENTGEQMKEYWQYTLRKSKLY